jgi:hypothetical protein
MAKPLVIVTIGSPKTINGKEGRYELAAFYGDLLGMTIANEGWLLIADEDEERRKLYLALDGDGWEEQRPPRWPDPEYPQQLHLDVLVPDLDAAAALVTGMGARLLRDNGAFRIYADPVGHPFCLYADETADRPVVGRLVFDCLSPRSLASFYEGFLGDTARVLDTPERVVVDLNDEKLPDFGFQHAVFRAARWPDPAYPAQLHVDYRWGEGLEAEPMRRAERLGAVRMPDFQDAITWADPAAHVFCIQPTEPTSQA